MAQLPNLISVWLQDRATHARNLAAAELGSQINPAVDPTSLAICVFGCSNGCYSCTYSDLWRHHCVRRYRFYGEFIFPDVDTLYEGNGDITFDSKRSAMVSYLVTMVSRDPTTTTVENMDSWGRFRLLE
ncbi:uncharacterized protein BT62DRAFT_473346 [Guyanagaster necrorhizus]|uniref:Uncharacterized protein n=1 Tax=Guyanagaster necrorhizus TaxID=856835 RepID=A0A9P7VIB2_9AGAR|nr:uncharacterized protein BT62DRAFT_473346 [Guyanagaster necrorhizus MCA 3950]KAG7441568.1 hypothetical protein BT62DRAFT_473346 [Guyanagaster necrorhizus MCA 3950]